MKLIHLQRQKPRGVNRADTVQSCYSANMPPIILDSRKLLAFSTLARVGSFTLAARELNLTQSAVSHAIKALEKDLEARLFERIGRKVTITAAGRQLLQHTHVILAEMQHARAGVAAFGD